MNGRIDRTTKGNGLEKDMEDRSHTRKRIVSLTLAAVMVFSAVFIVMSVSDSSDAAPVDVYTCGTLDELKDAVAAANSDEHVTDGKWSKDAHHVLNAQWAPDDSHIENGYVMEIAAACALEALIIVCAVMVIMRRR